MKTIISLIFTCCILANFNLFGQTGSTNGGSFCATGSNVPDLLQSISSSQFQARSSHYTIRIFVHIMRMSDGSGGQTYEEVDDALNILYSDFDEHGVCFNLVGWDEINDDNLYQGVGFSQLAPYMDDSRIDLFLFANDKLNSGQANGIPGNALRIGGNLFGSNLVTSRVISHEMGHCLGLYHTFHGLCESGCAELVNGSNCTTCGDFVCDTDADPQTFEVDGATCAWNGTTCGGATTDANGDPYNPPTNLIMQYIDPLCMQVHTTGQGTRMKDMIANSSLLQQTVTTDDPTVLYMKDNPNDFGIEPNPRGSNTATTRFWISKDMWIRNVDDGGTTHQNPEYTTIDPIYLYVRVRNKGCEPSSGTEQLKTYWTKATAGLTGWPTAFDNYTESGVLSGDIIGTTTIPVLNPGESTILKFPWYAPNPDDFVHLSQEMMAHVCLLSRIETSPTSPFGMTFTETNKLWSNGNVDKNNKVIWKNTTIVDNDPNNFGGGVVVGHTVASRHEYDLIFSNPYDELSDPFTDNGTVTVDLGEVVYDKWVKGGKKGSGFEEGKYSHMSSTGVEHHNSPHHFPNAPSPYTIVITGTEARLENLTFEPNEIQGIDLIFNFSGTTEKDFTYDLLQGSTESGEIVGGMTFDIHKPECILPDAGQDVTVGRGCTTTLIASPTITGAIYKWFDDATGNFIAEGQSIEVSPAKTTVYELQMVSPNRCVDYDVITVNVDNNLTACNTNIEPPGCFDNVEVFPNPASGNDLHLKFMAEERANIDITVVDMQGRVRERDNFLVEQPGTVERIIPLHNIPPGVYKVIIRCKDKVHQEVVTRF